MRHIGKTEGAIVVNYTRRIKDYIMGKTVFLYAGQGSQNIGMGKDLYETFPEFRSVYDRIHLHFDLKAVSFFDLDNNLNNTRYTQPCMVAFACGVTEILKKAGVVPDYVGGLSLGEYSALYAAGVWNLEDVMQIIVRRADAMATASEGISSAMIAISGLDYNQVDACCSAVAEEGVVSVCNLNCPGQIVIGGLKKAVEAAAVLAKNNGAKRCVRIPVSGPFHTSIMKPVTKDLEEVFKHVNFATPKADIVYNVLGGPNIEGMPIEDLLIRQVVSPVRMHECLEYLFAVGTDTFIEIGPGNALAGFVKKTAIYNEIPDNSYRVASIESVDDISTAMTLLQHTVS